MSSLFLNVNFSILNKILDLDFILDTVVRLRPNQQHPNQFTIQLKENLNRNFIFNISMELICKILLYS